MRIIIEFEKNDETSAVRTESAEREETEQADRIDRTETEAIDAGGAPEFGSEPVPERGQSATGSELGTGGPTVETGQPTGGAGDVSTTGAGSPSTVGIESQSATGAGVPSASGAGAADATDAGPPSDDLRESVSRGSRSDELENLPRKG